MERHVSVLKIIFWDQQKITCIVIVVQDPILNKEFDVLCMTKNSSNVYQMTYLSFSLLPYAVLTHLLCIMFILNDYSNYLWNDLIFIAA